jgi:hypothetical protein
MSSSTMITYTVRVNGVDTLLVVALAANVAEGSNTGVSVVVAQGDDISIKIVKAASLGAGGGGIRAVTSMELA